MVIRCAASAEASNVDYLLLWPSFTTQEYSFSTNPRLATLSLSEVTFTPPGGRRPLDETSHLGTPRVALEVRDSETREVFNLPTAPVDKEKKKQLFKEKIVTVTYLVSSMQEEPTTIIITTHYIEEARGADRLIKTHFLIRCFPLR